MNSSIFKCLTLFLFAVSVVNSIRPLERHSYLNENKNAKPHSIKIVSYAIKSGDVIEIKTVPVRNLAIEPYRDWVAKGMFDGANYNTTGWSLLEIETNEQASDEDQAFGAGLLEGYLTKDLINLHLINTVGDFCEEQSKTCSDLVYFLTSNYKWIINQISENKNDPYWHQVDLVFHQFSGLFHGYYGSDKNHIQINNVLHSMVKDIKPYLKLLALQLNGDMSELLASLNQESNPFIAGSCSALIKLLPNNQDLFVSHVTWTVYESMLRILKHLKLNYHLNNLDSTVIPGSEVSFSSYPGILVSIDDFYVLKSRLVVLETTIGNSNVDLWKYVTPFTNLYWVRNLVANRLSTNGTEWANWFSLYNSGTYNNEWMIVDFNQFTPGEPLRPGLLTVLEQLPGSVVATDRTQVLKTSAYWPSYNLPYYPEVYNLSGTYDAFVKYGSFFSYTDSPRSSIFRRDHVNVHDIPSMINMMRYNNYTYDPLSRCECDPPYSGENTISARSDLNPANGKYPFDALGHRDHGATDMKMTNFGMSQQMNFIGICGPTYNEDVPPFVWSTADFGNSTNHFGHPDKWTFEPFYTKWKL